jgi:hypothetical protein
MQGSYKNRLKSIWPRSMQEASDESPPDSWSGRAKTWEHELERCMGEHPKATLAAAVMVGLFVGWLVKRK